VGFQPLLLQTALTYLLLTAAVSGVHSLLDGRWQWYAGHVQLLGLAALLKPHLDARVRHRRQAFGGALTAWLAGLVVIHQGNVPVPLWQGVAMVLAAAAFSGITRMPTWFFSRARAGRDRGA
jgi:hypothetical protein